MKSEKKQAPFFEAVLIWSSITCLFLISIFALYVWKGIGAFDILTQAGPISNASLTFMSVALTWITTGALLFWLHFQHPNTKNIICLGAFLLVALLYLNILRERPQYGDVHYYIEASTNLHLGKHLPTTYFYPPFWATLLEIFMPFGEEAIFNLVWMGNVGALFTFFFLLIKILQHYGFSFRLAVLATVIFMVVNVPILRTLVYMQVNLHVVNLIFLSLLLWRRKPFLSALALALAVHFKASPIILVFAFILERDWRWLAWFTLNFFLIGAFSYLSHGISPFVDFVHNVLSLPASRGINFRENSFDSLFFALTTFFKADNFPTQYLIYIVKFIVGVITLIVVAANIKHQTFYKEETRGKYLFNSIPALLVLLTLASPIVWVHHGVFLALAFLVILKRLSSSFQWTLYGFAYFLEFLVPTFDFFPWSYGRLLSPMIILGLLWLLPRQQNRPSVFEAINCWLPKINTIRDASSGEGI